jgi:hypothetical protein
MPASERQQAAAWRIACGGGNKMSRHRRLKAAPLGAAALLAVGVIASTAGPVAAECDGPPPSFRDYAPHAARVVIGDVAAVDPTKRTDDDGRSSWFSFRVRYVLRGEAPSLMTIRGLSFLECADHLIWARPGDRLALATGITAFNPPMTFSTAAWIKGMPPLADFERMTTREVFEVLGLAPPDTSTGSSTPPEDSLPWPALGGALLAGVGAVAISRRRSTGMTRHRRARPA